MRVTVIAHPGSRKPRTEKDLFGDLHVFISEPPLEGKANKAITESLAVYFGVSKSKIKLLKGEKSKHKVFDISK